MYQVSNITMTETYPQGVFKYHEPGIEFIAFPDCNIMRYHKDQSTTIKQIHVVPFLDYSDTYYLLDADSLTILERNTVQTILSSMTNELLELCNKGEDDAFIKDIDEVDEDELTECIPDLFATYDTANITNMRQICSYAEYDDTYSIPGNRTLCIQGPGIFTDCITYVIRDESNGTILATLESPDSSLQIGDGETEIYLLNEKDIIVCNNGDVSSVVFIRLSQ